MLLKNSWKVNESEIGSSFLRVIMCNIIFCVRFFLFSFYRTAVFECNRKRNGNRMPRKAQKQQHNWNCIANNKHENLITMQIETEVQLFPSLSFARASIRSLYHYFHRNLRRNGTFTNDLNAYSNPKMLTKSNNNERWKNTQPQTIAFVPFIHRFSFWRWQNPIAICNVLMCIHRRSTADDHLFCSLLLYDFLLVNLLSCSRQMRKAYVKPCKALQKIVR